MVNWVLVIALASNPQDYHVYGGFRHEENCAAAQERYSRIFKETGANVRAECRPRNDVRLGQPTSVVFKTYVIR